MNIFFVNPDGEGQRGIVLSSNHDLRRSRNSAARNQTLVWSMPVTNARPVTENIEMLPRSLDTGNKARLSSPHATQVVETIQSKSIMTALFTEARRVLSVVSMWQERAATRHALARLDDHLLLDIGLTRADVERERMKPFWRK
jgi:uncharacterized protein YjiS (DUF1127 family)